MIAAYLSCPKRLLRGLTRGAPRVRRGGARGRQSHLATFPRWVERAPRESSEIVPKSLSADFPQALHRRSLGASRPTSLVENRAPSLHSPEGTGLPRSAGDPESRSVLLASSGGEQFSTRQPTRRSRGAPVGVSHSPRRGRSTRRRGGLVTQQSIRQGWRRFEASRTARRRKPHERYGVRVARLRVRRASLASHSEAPEANGWTAAPSFLRGLSSDNKVRGEGVPTERWDGPVPL